MLTRVSRSPLLLASIALLAVTLLPRDATAIPPFARKPIFGYPFMVFSGIAIGFMGWGVWAHHMFASGLGPISVAAFSVSTMFIAVPTGVKILNWMATLWGGKITFSTPLLFSVGLVAMFTIGGLSGVTHAVAPADTQQTDTYYIVAHFHYVLFGGAMMGLFSGFYFWWPKVFGHFLNEKLGKVAEIAFEPLLHQLRKPAGMEQARHRQPGELERTGVRFDDTLAVVTYRQVARLADGTLVPVLMGGVRVNVNARGDVAQILNRTFLGVDGLAPARLDEAQAMEAARGVRAGLRR